MWPGWPPILSPHCTFSSLNRGLAKILTVMLASLTNISTASLSLQFTGGPGRNRYWHCSNPRRNFCSCATVSIFFCCKVDYFSFNSKFPAECVILPWQVKWALITWFWSKSLSWPSTMSPSIERQQTEKNYKINKQNKHKKVFLAKHNVISRLTPNRHKTSNEANKQINKQNKHRKSALT